MRFNVAWERLFGYTEDGFHELMRQHGIQGAFNLLAGESGDVYGTWMAGVILQLTPAPHMTATMRVRMRVRRADIEYMLLTAHLEHAPSGSIRAIVFTWTREQ